MPGQNLVLPEEAWQELRIAFSFAGADADADLTLFLTDTGGQVTCDEDFVFYNQPSADHGAARLLGKQTGGPHTVERAALHIAALPAHIQRVTIAIDMDVDTGLTCSALLAGRTPGAVRRRRHCSRSAADDAVGAVPAAGHHPLRVRAQESGEVGWVHRRLGRVVLGSHSRTSRAFQAEMHSWTQLRLEPSAGR
ncbi:TerD family protein [Streptomyces sp. NPDC046931]|uniref:TerD family protein n=1 Tax=Streptomyces sp. NPDC046931 TaxID=3154806 RepID=UPI0033CC007A